MLERFTERSRRVLQLAREEAGRFNHEYIGTEHLLLGLVAEGKGVAAQVLRRLGLDLDRLRRAVEELIQSGPAVKELPDKLPLTPRARKALDLASQTAQELGHAYVGTEHLLLGLMREGQGVAARVLRTLGVDLDAARKTVLAVVGMAEGPSGGEDEEGDEQEGEGGEAPPTPVPQREIPWPEWVKEAVNAPDILEVERQAAAIRAEKEAAVTRQEFEVAARKRDEERILREALPGRASLRALRALLDRPDDPACRALRELGLDLDAGRRHLDGLLKAEGPSPDETA